MASASALSGPAADARLALSAMGDETGIIRGGRGTGRRGRKAAGLAQEKLALKAGLDRTYSSRVERSKRNVTIVVLSRIAGR